MTVLREYEYKAWDADRECRDGARVVEATGERHAAIQFCEQEWTGMDADIYATGRNVCVLGPGKRKPVMFTVELEAVPVFRATVVP